MKRPVYCESWSDEVRGLHDHDMEEIWDCSIAPHMYMRYHYLLDFYLGLVRSEKRLAILDFGCAEATLALILAERGYRVTAVDIRPDLLEYTASRFTHGDIRFLAGNLFEEDLLREQFDLVFANQIIEHVLQPEQKVRILAKRMKNSGRLIMTTPNFSYFRSGLPSYQQFLNHELEFEENSAGSDGHMFAFNLSELTDQIERAGLKVIQSGFLETPFVNGHTKIRHATPYMDECIWKEIDSRLLSIRAISPYVAHQQFVVAEK